MPNYYHPLDGTPKTKEEEWLKKINKDAATFGTYGKYLIDEDFIRRNKNFIHWHGVGESQELSENFIREFSCELDWIKLCIYQKLSEPFIREFKNEVNWNLISSFQYLSEDFIEEFQSKIDWGRISEHVRYYYLINKKSPQGRKQMTYKRQFSTPFIRKFKDKLDWKEISKYKTFTKDFIEEFYNLLDLNYLKNRRKRIIGGMNKDKLESLIILNNLS